MPSLSPELSYGETLQHAWELTPARHSRNIG